MEVFLTVLRWIVCIPAGIFCGFLAQYAYVLFMGDMPTIGLDQHGILGLLAGVVGGAMTIYVSAKIAPTEKKLWLCFPLTLLSFFNAGFAVYVYLSFPDESLFDVALTWAQVLGSVLVTYATFNGSLEY